MRFNNRFVRIMQLCRARVHTSNASIAKRITNGRYPTGQVTIYLLIVHSCHPVVLSAPRCPIERLLSSLHPFLPSIHRHFHHPCREASTIAIPSTSLLSPPTPSPSSSVPALTDDRDEGFFRVPKNHVAVRRFNPQPTRPRVNEPN